jgi:hypothetical protein
VVDRYLALGLRLGRHLDGLVDAYYGPPELAAAVDAEALRPLRSLIDDAARLIVDLDGGAGEPDVGAARRRWLRAHAVGLHTTARKLDGEAIAFADEVERCYGARPRRVPEDEFAAAHAALDEVLPGAGPLRERYDAWRDAHVVPVDRVPEVLTTLADDFRARTIEAFGLPDGEHVDWQLVTDKPWSGFNYYEGGLRSRVAINTDLPTLSLQLPHLVAHESYPGHHTEHCRKEVGLVRQHGHLEETIFLVGTPQCLMAEGLADLALEALLGERPEPVVAELFGSLDVRYDAEVVQRVRGASEALGSVRQNAAFLLHEDGQGADEVSAYVQRWSLLPKARADKAVQFLTDPTWRAYISCYVEGLPLCRAFVAGDPARFERLLTEPLLPADLVAA